MFFNNYLKHLVSTFAVLTFLEAVPTHAQDTTGFDQPLSCSEKYNDSAAIALCDAVSVVADISLSDDNVDPEKNAAAIKSIAQIAFNDVDNWKSKQLFDEVRSGGRATLFWYYFFSSENAHYLKLCQDSPIETIYQETEKLYSELVNQETTKLLMKRFTDHIDHLKVITNHEESCNVEELKLATQSQLRSTNSFNSIINRAKKQVIYRKWEGSDRLFAARLQACKAAIETNSDEQYDNAIALAISKFPAIGPSNEILDRCQYYSTGQIEQLRKRIAEIDAQLP